MATLNMLSLKTQGVDYKTNPLLLGNLKLHSAVNLAFDENTIKTRPGFKFVDLNVSGVVQGVTAFRPSQGVSSGVFGDDLTGVAMVISGDIYFSEVNACGQLCQTVRLTTDKPYVGLGDVHLFQAENYLIIQNPRGPTMWWDGRGIPVRSPGQIEIDWNDPDTPSDEIDFIPPVANIPDCETPDPSWVVDVRVIDALTLQSIPTPSWSVRTTSEIIGSGVGSDTGEFSVEPTQPNCFYSISKKGYIPKEDVPITFKRSYEPITMDDGCWEAPGRGGEVVVIELWSVASGGSGAGFFAEYPIPGL